MPIVEWNESFLLDVPELDQHHRHLVSLLNDAYDGFTTGISFDAIEGILGELADYASYHFVVEEAWMQKSNYPNLADHKDEHGRFIVRVHEIVKAQQEDHMFLLMEIMEFLNDWLSTHILQTDAEFGQYLKS
jgi:hemerythrin-like metal-binding protein